MRQLLAFMALGADSPSDETKKAQEKLMTVVQPRSAAAIGSAGRLEVPLHSASFPSSSEAGVREARREAGRRPLDAHAACAAEMSRHHQPALHGRLLEQRPPNLPCLLPVDTHRG